MLGSMLLSEWACRIACEGLAASDFYHHAHATVFEAIQGVRRAGEPVDLLPVRRHLDAQGMLEKCGSRQYLLELVECVTSPADVEYYIAVVRQQKALRALTELGEIAQATHVPGADPSDLVARVRQCIQRSLPATDAIRPLPDILADAEQYLEDVARGENRTVPLGIDALDDTLGGLAPGMLTVVCGKPGIGKTALATTALCKNAVRDRRGCLFFSAEMSGRQVVTNMLRQLARIDYSSVRKGTFAGSNYARWQEWRNRMARVPLYIDDSPGILIEELVPRAERYVEDRDVDLIVVDYLQILRTRRDLPRNLEVAHAAQELKRLARQVDVPVLALSQVTVSEGHVRARWAAEIEEVSDLVILMLPPKADGQQPGPEPDICRRRLVVTKNRYGSQRAWEVGFNKPFLSFEGASKTAPQT